MYSHKFTNPESILDRPVERKKEKKKGGQEGKKFLQLLALSVFREKEKKKKGRSVFPSPQGPSVPPKKKKGGYKGPAPPAKPKWWKEKKGGKKKKKEKSRETGCNTRGTPFLTKRGGDYPEKGKKNQEKGSNCLVKKLRGGGKGRRERRKEKPPENQKIHPGAWGEGKGRGKGRKTPNSCPAPPRKRRKKGGGKKIHPVPIFCAFLCICRRPLKEGGGRREKGIKSFFEGGPIRSGEI